MSQTPAFILVDWGSSSFRAFLVSSGGDVIEERHSDQGAFQISNYEETLAAMCGDWHTGDRPIPVRMGGSIGSRNGWQETNYLPCPVSLNDMKQSFVAVENTLGWDIAVLPGVSLVGGMGECDVMRGEETQIFGALDLLEKGSGFFCLPGTHSKWCQVEEGRITNISSYLSGEMYALLMKNGSLSPLIAEGTYSEAAFLDGLHAIARQPNLMNFLFRARAGVLLDQFSGDRLSSYLSGALIGYEVRHAMANVLPDETVIIIAGAELQAHYCLAMQELGRRHSAISGEDAFLAGMKLLVS